MNINYDPFRSEQAKLQYLDRYHQRLQEWPISYTEQFISTAYGETLVRISGPMDAPPLILLHGAGTCSLQWLHNIKDLSKHYRTYAIDGLIHIGCLGKSIPKKPIREPRDAVTWLDELFNLLDLDSDITLLGASHGGWLASQYTLHRQKRLNKLILIAPAGFTSSFSTTYMLRTILLGILPIKQMYHSFFNWAFQDLAQKDKILFNHVIDDFLFSAQCFKPINPKELPVLKFLNNDELQQIQLPTQFLIGENEVLYSAKSAIQRIQSIAPHIQTELIAHTGHDLLLTQAKLVNTKINNFLHQ